MESKKTKIYSARSATRIDLAGGTLDLWPLSALVENAATINCSINCFTEVSFTPSKALSITVESPDFKTNFQFESLNTFLKATDNKLSLLKESFKTMESPERGLGEWHLKSESPAGSGLGGSSSLVISILKVMEQLEVKTSSDEILIEKAKNTESRVLKTPAGIQDYFSPVEEGLNFITYKSSGFKRRKMNKAFDFIKSRLTIIDSEIKHHSGMNNWEILKKFIDGDKKVIGALNEISQITHDLKEALEEEDIEKVKICFDKELVARRNVSDSYINKDLEGFLNKLKAHKEVKALKVCGAGGGGCVLLLHEPENRNEVRQKLKCLETFI